MSFSCINLKCLLSIGVVVFFLACKKEVKVLEDGIFVTKEKVGFLESQEELYKIDELSLSTDGEKDTIYIFSQSAVKVYLNEATDWVEIIHTEYLESIQGLMVVLRAEALSEDFSERIGELVIDSDRKYFRRFFKVAQGYRVRYSEDFSWLFYGGGDPLKVEEGILLGDWAPAQKDKGWTAVSAGGDSEAFVIGKRGYVQIGIAERGASLISPKIIGVQNDSIALLSFDAVSFVNKDGALDGNKLTLKLSDAVFEDGSNEKVLDLGYIDHLSALLNIKMWENNTHALRVFKPNNEDVFPSIQVAFVSGDKIEEEKNRVFLRNVNLFSVSRYGE